MSVSQPDSGNASDSLLAVHVNGPGRCSGCSWHVPTQGHRPECPGGTVATNEKPMPPPQFRLLPWISDERARERARFLTPVKPPAPRRKLTQTRLDAWLESTFHTVIADVRSQGRGSRNTRLRWAARRFGELAHLGPEVLDETRCKQALMEASAPWDYNEAGRRQSRATIKSGWDKGVSTPKDESEVMR